MTGSRSHPWWVWGLRVGGHLAGVAVVLSVFALLFVNAQAMEVLQVGLLDSQFYKLVTLPLLLEVGLAACIWAMFVIMYQWVHLSFVEAKAGKRPLALKRSKGTIMTETLIVMPIFLLLTSGLAQLAINSSAGVLMAVGTFQASRTAWLWEPETRPDNPRNGMQGDRGGVEERARIAAATVLAPVAPAEFRGSCDFSTLFDDRIRAIGVAGTYAGTLGAGSVQTLTNSQQEATGRNLFYFSAFDTSTFAERGAKKFYLAYCLTSATYRDNGDEIETSVTYNHVNAFPWFAYLFGTNKEVAGSRGYYSEFTNSARFPKQIDVNPREAMSLSSTFDDILDRIGL